MSRDNLNKELRFSRRFSGVCVFKTPRGSKFSGFWGLSFPDTPIRVYKNTNPNNICLERAAGGHLSSKSSDTGWFKSEYVCIYYVHLKDHKMKDLLKRRVAESQSTDVGWVDSFWLISFLMSPRPVTLRLYPRDMRDRAFGWKNHWVAVFAPEFQNCPMFAWYFFVISAEIEYLYREDLSNVTLLRVNDELPSRRSTRAGRSRRPVTESRSGHGKTREIKSFGCQSWRYSAFFSFFCINFPSFSY